jgi:hypothetical protein
VQLDFRPQSIELQLNLRQARQFVVQLEINLVDLSPEEGYQRWLMSWHDARSARRSCGSATYGSPFHVQYPAALRPWMRLGSITAIAATSRICRKPPIVTELMKPRSHNIARAIASVDNGYLQMLTRPSAHVTDATRYSSGKTGAAAREVSDARKSRL